MGRLGSRLLASQQGTDNCLSINITGLENLKSYIALFNKIPLLGAKALDYRDFCLGLDIIAALRSYGRLHILHLQELTY